MSALDALNSIPTPYRSQLRDYYLNGAIPTDDTLFALVMGDVEPAFQEAGDKLQPVLNFLCQHMSRSHWGTSLRVAKWHLGGGASGGQA